MHLLFIDNQHDNDSAGGIELDPRRDEDFAVLVEKLHSGLLIYARALCKDEATARDIVQEAFIVAYEKVRTFDVTRDFATWMRGIVRNKWREWVRKNRRYEFTEEEIAFLDAEIAAWQARLKEEGNPLFEALDDCLLRLPENLRIAVHACYFEGRTSEEAAELLGIAPAAIRKRLQRARESLKLCLDRKLSLGEDNDSSDSSSITLNS